MRFLKSNNEILNSSISYFKHCDFWANMHDNIEILYIISGSMRILVNDKEYALSKGDFIVFFPFEVHKCIELTDDCENCCIAINATRISGYDFSLYDVKPKTHLITAKDVSERARKIYSLIDSIPENQDKEVCTALTVALFFDLMLKLELVPRFCSDGVTSERIILNCVENFKDHNFSLDKLSKMVGLSTRTLSRFFKDYLNMTFPKFIAQLRLNYSVECLLNGMSVTEAANFSGFGSLRSFNRNFNNEYKCSPRDYISLAESDL